MDMKIVIGLLLLLALAACGGQEDTDHWFQPEESAVAEVSSETTPPTVLEEIALEDTALEDTEAGSTVHVLAHFDELANMRVYIQLFNHLHPHIHIQLESYRHPRDTTEHMALVTRLITDPPDIMLLSGGLDFSKTSLPTLFVDLNQYIDGPSGLDRDRFFNNVFLAAEAQGGLFHAPLHVNVDVAFLNKRLFDAIGVDATQFTSFTFADAIYYYPRIQAAFPDEEIFISDGFSPWLLLEHSHLFDLETGEVYVNTPQMQALLTAAMDIPVNYEMMNLTPDHKLRNFPASDFNRLRHIHPSSNMLYLPFDGTRDFGTFFLTSHPYLQFTHPIPFGLINQEKATFVTRTSLALMAGAPNPEDAWEFIRFILSVEDSFIQNIEYVLVDGQLVPDVPDHFVVKDRYDRRNEWVANRARLDNHFTHVTQQAQEMVHHMVSMPPPPEDQLALAMDFYRHAIDNVHYLRQRDYLAMLSLIYPEFWLLWSGQQDVEQTLYNMHNRLQLYVNE